MDAIRDKALDRTSTQNHLLDKRDMHKKVQSDMSTTGPKLWVVLARAYGALASYVEDCIAAERLGLSDFMVLEVLLHKGPMSISAIGEKVLLANASMTAAVDRLEERGCVVRQNSENDRRSKIVALTREGRAFISDLYARHARDIEAVTSVLSQREQDQLRSLLKKLGLSAKAATWKRAQEPGWPSPKQSSKERQR
jgi:MarR family transcriptional regulator, 2-MHQ and catechol-resistance regulon repressor